MKVITQIPSMDDNALARLLGNARAMLIKNPDQASALSVVNAINDEWERRLDLFRKGQYKASSPKGGVLSAVGYKVGNAGENTSVRHQLLDHILSGNLPPVGSPAYMEEWGEPLSRTRFIKLHRVIRVLASSAAHDDKLHAAMEDWEEDLRYLDSKWAHLRDGRE